MKCYDVMEESRGAIYDRCLQTPRPPLQVWYGSQPIQGLAIASPCLTLHHIALPCLALNCVVLPCIALPCRTLPLLALYCLAHNHIHRGGEVASTTGGSKAQAASPPPSEGAQSLNHTYIRIYIYIYVYMYNICIHVCA